MHGTSAEKVRHLPDEARDVCEIFQGKAAAPARAARHMRVTSAMCACAVGSGGIMRLTDNDPKHAAVGCAIADDWATIPEE